MKNFALYLLVGAGVTYLIRMIPLVFIRKKIENKFILSFLYYMPYAVLTVMTIPACIVSGTHLISGVLALIIAGALAIKEKSATLVAISFAAVVLITEYIIAII